MPGNLIPPVRLDADECLWTPIPWPPPRSPISSSLLPPNIVRVPIAPPLRPPSFGTQLVRKLSEINLNVLARELELQASRKEEATPLPAVPRVVAVLGIAFELVKAREGVKEEEDGDGVGRAEQDEIEVLWGGTLQEWEQRRRRRQGWLPSPEQGTRQIPYGAGLGRKDMLMPFFFFPF